MNSKTPTCYIIAGPNGAGKTTFAMRYLPQMTGCEEFINADMIAQGLSPLNPARSQIDAGKIFIREVRNKIQQRVDFAFETTLSGRGHVRVLKQMREAGWRIDLFFLWIPDVTFSETRVRERVEHGGHDIPQEALHRRFPRVLRNLVDLYVPLCDRMCFYDNSGQDTELVFIQSCDERDIRNAQKYHAVLELLK